MLLFLIVPVPLHCGDRRRDRLRGRPAPSGGTSERWYRLDRFARANGMSYVPHLAAPGAARDDLRHRRLAPVDGSRARRQAAVRRVRQLLLHDGLGQEPDHPAVGLRRGQAGRAASEHRARCHEQQLPLRLQPPRRLRQATSGSASRATSTSTSRCTAPRATSAMRSTSSRPTSWRGSSTTPRRSTWRSSTTGCSCTASAQFSSLDPATWAWLFSVVGALLDKLAQWARWRDERLQTDAGAPASAPSGGLARRCRRALRGSRRAAATSAGRRARRAVASLGASAGSGSSSSSPSC